MATPQQRGKAFEQRVAKLIRQKTDSGAKRNNGSHANWHRRSDIFTNLPLHVEAKSHETLKPKEWFRQAEAAASFSQTPVVVFEMDEEVMSLLRFEDLLDLFVQVSDLEAEIKDIRLPQVIKTPEQAEEMVKEHVSLSVRQAVLCRAHHIADDYGYCYQKDCKFNRSYVAPKGKK